jgi:O-Glycosyl hydrolase family 30
MTMATLSISQGSNAADYVDVVDVSKRHQTIDYFAASDCWSIQKIGGWSDPNRQKVADLLFSREKGIGLSGWRFNLGAGIEETRIGNSWRTVDCFEIDRGKYDWTKCENARWFLRAAKSNGVDTFIAFCNSPPKRLTRNGLTVADDDHAVSNNLRPGMEGEYGTYLADILLHFRNNPEEGERINFRWVSPINEPQWDWVGGQEGTRAANADIVRQYRAIYAQLQAHHLSTHILGPESGSLPGMYEQDRGASGKYHSTFGDYVDLLCNDEMAAALNRTICFHSYWSEGADHLIPFREALRKKLDQHPGWKPVQSEFCIMEHGRDLSMNAALRAMRVVHCDLSIVNVTSWSWWLSVANGDYKDGLIYTDWKLPGDEESVLPSKLMWSLGNYSRFIHPGMLRVEVTQQGARHDLEGVVATAYYDPATKSVVAVYINSSNEPASLKLGEVQRDELFWTPYITSDTLGDDLRQYPPFKSGEAFTLPARAVVSLVSSKP